MLPIRRGDGTGLSAKGFSEVRKGDGTVLWSAGTQIPDSVVSRPADTGTFDTDASSGIVISPKEDFPEIGAVISQNVSGATRARLYDYSSGSYVRSVDISSLSAGDAFSFEFDFETSNDYGFELDADGSTYTQGFADESNYPYTGEQIDIVARSEAGSQSGGVPTNVNDVGSSGL